MIYHTGQKSQFKLSPPFSVMQLSNCREVTVWVCFSCADNVVDDTDQENMLFDHKPLEASDFSVEPLYFEV